MENFKAGWIPDIPDKRDLKYLSPRRASRLLPGKAFIKQYEPPIYDQGNLGSCVANGVGALMQFCQKKQGLSDFIPSRLFLYYNARVLEGTVSQDCGATIRDGIKIANKLGVCQEDAWPYDVAKFAKNPPKACFAEALKNQALKYERISQGSKTTKYDIMYRVGVDGFPITLGITLYDSFMSAKVAKTGKVPMPNVQKENCIGGHCVNLVGYDTARDVFIMRNSWGTSWGAKGYFTIPMEYILDGDLCDDIWTITLIEDGK